MKKKKKAGNNNGVETEVMNNMIKNILTQRIRYLVCSHELVPRGYTLTQVQQCLAQIVQVKIFSTRDFSLYFLKHLFIFCNKDGKVRSFMGVFMFVRW